MSRAQAGEIEPTPFNQRRHIPNMPRPPQPSGTHANRYDSTQHKRMDGFRARLNAINAGLSRFHSDWRAYVRIGLTATNFRPRVATATPFYSLCVLPL